MTRTILGACALLLVPGCLGGEAAGPQERDAGASADAARIADAGPTVDARLADAYLPDATPSGDASLLPSGFSARVTNAGAGANMRCIYDGSEGANAVKTWTAQPQPHILLKCASPVAAGAPQFVVTLTINPLAQGDVIGASEVLVQKVGGGSVMLGTATAKSVRVATFAPAEPHLIGQFSASWTTGIGGQATGVVGSFDVH